MKDTVRLSIDVPTNYHKALRYYAINHNTTVKDFFLDLFEKHMPQEIEDQILGSLASESKKQGSIGKKESEKLLKSLKNKIKK